MCAQDVAQCGCLNGHCRTARGMRGRVVEVGLCAWVCAGCSGDATNRGVQADAGAESTGPMVVTNVDGSPWTPETAWQFEEDLRLGSVIAEQPHAFGMIMSVVADASGMIYVLDVYYQRIQVFYPSGAFSHTIGRRGEGPGELSAARSMAIGPGETLWVIDDGSVRYSAFSLDGTFRDSHLRRVRGFYAAASGAFVRAGSYIDWGIGFPDGRLGPRTVLWPIRLRARFERADSFPPLEYKLPSGQWPTLPFTGRLSVAIDRQGSLWFAHTEEYRIYRRNLRGDTTLIFGLPASPPRTGKVEREYVRAEFEQDPGRYLSGLPETKPIVHRIVPDNAGHIFVFVDVAGIPAGSVVDVFQDSGKYLGRMALPTPVPLFPPSHLDPVAYATSEHLYVVVKDKLDVPYVSRLRIVKGRQRGSPGREALHRQLQ